MIKQVARIDLEHLARFFHSAYEIECRKVGDSKIVMAGAVGRIILDQILVRLDRLFVISAHCHVVETERAVPFTAGHRVHVRERFLPELFGLRIPADIEHCECPARIGAAEIGVEFDRLAIVIGGLTVVTGISDVLCLGVGLCSFQRGSGEHFLAA